MARYSVSVRGQAVELEAERVELYPDRNQIIFFDADDQPVAMVTGTDNFFKLPEDTVERGGES